MLDTIKNTVSFTGVAIGATASLPHGLNLNAQPLTPDSVRFSTAFELVSANTTTITVRNVSAAGGSCVVLCEAWHPIERSFGIAPDDGSLSIHLVPQPYSSSFASSTGGGGPTVVVFRPGGVAEKNVAITWDSALALLSLSEGNRVLQFDSSVVSPIVIPVGGPYQMTDVTWSGSFGISAPEVHIPEGASFTGLRGFDDRIRVVFTGTTPPVSDLDPSTPTPDTVFVDHGAVLTTAGAGPMLQLSAAGPSGVIVALRAGGVIETGTAPVFDLAVAGANAGIVMIDGAANLGSDTLSSVVGANLFILVGDSGVAQASEDQPAFLGSLAFQNLTKLYRYPAFPILSTNTSLTETSQLVQLDPSLGAFVVTLPPAFNRRGQSISIKNVTSDVTPVAIAAGPGDQLDGAPSAILSGAFAFMEVTSDGSTNWYITS
jgi:hypothetical protein